MLLLRYVHPGPGPCIFSMTLHMSAGLSGCLCTSAEQKPLIFFRTTYVFDLNLKASQRGSGLSHDSSLLYPVQKAPSKPFLLQAQKWGCIIVWAAFERLNDP